ncbi:hypothetical protein [Levilactobacillus brevis]|uniref:hypothetical protein n=1 Tax=Levilactobacillus brevis TaxID=1580 RepID=UPI001C1EF66C|nr:hypothetical protein [Levilactobacillus brevis]MBU7558424.1 hypothetical protein [Levilactobacillus brevis]MCE6011765.1 hypothetical protein [Levilactobacillus brevis]MCE6024491.1 hypothetical protein [Levilactobacillus brevis]MCE6037147.1 hypothetical protein [Levilactobacillus brevis]
MKNIKKNITIIALSFTLFMGGTVPVVPNAIVAHAKTTYVWIAPKHGMKYHYSKHCRGLKRASYKKHVTLRWAKKHGYTKCHFE